MQFIYAEDRAFFEALLCVPGEPLERYAALFDFRPMRVKRDEFKRLRGQLLAHLVARDEAQCQLQYPNRCAGADPLPVEKIEIDHLIPLATNLLNKCLRKMTTTPGHKVPSQSFGSNQIANLVVACHACNAHKKHRLLAAEQLRSILALRFP